MLSGPPPGSIRLEEEAGLALPEEEEEEEKTMAVGTRAAGGSPSSTIDPKTQRFPHSIVWTPLPPITWLLPFIGHMGLANKQGVIYDFAGPYTIGEGNLAFGRPTRYLQLDVRKCQSQTYDWDAGVVAGCVDYRKRMHNLCCDNCHSHVAQCLNYMEYGGFRRWNMVVLCFYFFFQARYAGVSGFLKTWLPFTVVLGLALVWHYMTSTPRPS